LFSTIRALPGDSIAGHTPEVFLHTILANTKSASALPTKGQNGIATVTEKKPGFSSFSPAVSLIFSWVFHGVYG